MSRLLVAIFNLTLVLALVGCGSSVVPSGVNVQVGVENPFTFTQAGSSPVVLNATVKFDGSNKGVKWVLATANVGCSPGCGTLTPQGSPSFSARYTPPADAPLNQQATIAAISVADDRQQFAFTFSIIPPASVKITKKFDSILTGSAPVPVEASVMNDPANAGVTWSLAAGGSACAPACGTLSSTGPGLSITYTPPATFPSGANVTPTITATSVTNTAASDSFGFTILSSNTLFKGNYAISVRGYDGNGLPMSLAGAIVADGNGTITNAEFDSDDYGGIGRIPAGQTGTYSVQVSPTGVTQALFEVSYTFPGATTPLDLKFRCVVSSDGKHGRIIELDGTGFINSGTIELQDASRISIKPSGNFAFGVNSDAPFGGRTVAAGQLVLGASGVAGGLIDQSVGAGITPTFVAEPLSPSTESDPDSLGRGTLTITAQGQSVDYAYYVVDSDHFTLIEIDRGLVFGTVFAGVARSQSALTSDSVNGVSVIQLTGFDTPTGTNDVVPVVLVGLLTVSNATTYALRFDINDMGYRGGSGSVLRQHAAGGSVTFDPATGRAALISPDGFGSNFVNAGAWYLYDKGKGFFVEEDISTTFTPPTPLSVTNRALSGTTLPQTGAPFTTASLSGNVIAGFGGSSSPLVPNAEFAISLVPGTAADPTTPGDYSATGDVTSSQNGNNPAVSFSGKYKLVDPDQGYGIILLPVPLFGDFQSPSGTQAQASFYMIAPNQFVGIGVDNAFLQISGVLFVDPQ